MIKVVRFIGGRYGLQNTITGKILEKDNGTPRMYRTQWGASRALRRMEKNFSRTMRKVQMSLDKK